MADESNTTTPPLVSNSGEPLGGGPGEVESQAAQIEALKAELESLRQSVAAMTSQARNVAGMGVHVAVDDVEGMLKRNVFASVGIAALIGYVWGKIR